MSRLLIDTNIVLDLLAKRKNFYNEAASLFSKADKNELILTTSSLTFANTNDIPSKQTLANEAREVLRKFKVLVETLSLNDKIVALALSDTSFPDFEDGFHYYSALENDIDVIISRDKKYFKNSKLRILTAKEYLASMKY